MSVTGLQAQGDVRREEDAERFAESSLLALNDPSGIVSRIPTYSQPEIQR